MRDVFGEAPSAPERALIYDTISPVEANLNPEWLDESIQLIAEPELLDGHMFHPKRGHPSAPPVGPPGTVLQF